MPATWTRVRADRRRVWSPDAVSPAPVTVVHGYAAPRPAGCERGVRTRSVVGIEATGGRSGPRHHRRRSRSPRRPSSARRERGRGQLAALVGRRSAHHPAAAPDRLHPAGDPPPAAACPSPSTTPAPPTSTAREDGGLLLGWADPAQPPGFDRDVSNDWHAPLRRRLSRFAPAVADVPIVVRLGRPLRDDPRLQRPLGEADAGLPLPLRRRLLRSRVPPGPGGGRGASPPPPGSAAGRRRVRASTLPRFPRHGRSGPSSASLSRAVAENPYTRRVRLVFAGTPEPALPAARRTPGSVATRLSAVVTRPDAPSGRGRPCTASPVAARAAELGIEALKPTRPRDPDFVARLTELAPDCCPVVAYGALIPQHVLDIPPHGWVNLHFSLLPAWRGAAPVQHALLAGDQVTGATTFRLVRRARRRSRLRHGRPSRSGPPTPPGDLLSRLAASGAGLLVADPGRHRRRLPGAAAAARGGRHLRPQDHTSTTPGSTGPTGRGIDRLVRGCTPAPGAWTTFRGERLKINAGPSTDRPAAAAGRARGHQASGTGGHRQHAARAAPRSRRRARSRCRRPTGPAASARPDATLGADSA